MEHQTLSSLRDVALVTSVLPHRLPNLSREDKLKRWAELLELQGQAKVWTFFETEHMKPRKRDAMRCHGSALSLAFADPLFKVAGLRNDSYGEAKRFFELTDWQMHRIVCYCNYGERVMSSIVAQSVRDRLREIVSPSPTLGFFARVRRAVIDWRAIPDHGPV